MGEKVINAALLGLGTVGTGVYKVLVLQNLVNTGSNCTKPKQGYVYNFFSHGELPS